MSTAAGADRAPWRDGLLLSEHWVGDGRLERTYLIRDQGALGLVVLQVPDPASASGAAGQVRPEAARILALPEGALDAVLRRYGKPLAEEVVTAGPELLVGDGAVLRSFRHLARFDVIALDYVAYRTPNNDELGALAAPVAAALRFLAERAGQA